MFLWFTTVSLCLHVIEVSLQTLCSGCCSASPFHLAVCHKFTFCLLSFLTFSLSQGGSTGTFTHHHNRNKSLKDLDLRRAYSWGIAMRHHERCSLAGYSGDHKKPGTIAPENNWADESRQISLHFFFFFPGEKSCQKLTFFLCMWLRWNSVFQWGSNVLFRFFWWIALACLHWHILHTMQVKTSQWIFPKSWGVSTQDELKHVYLGQTLHQSRLANFWYNQLNHISLHYKIWHKLSYWNILNAIPVISAAAGMDQRSPVTFAICTCARQQSSYWVNWELTVFSLSHCQNEKYPTGVTHWEQLLPACKSHLQELRHFPNIL